LKELTVRYKITKMMMTMTAAPATTATTAIPAISPPDSVLLLDDGDEVADSDEVADGDEVDAAAGPGVVDTVSESQPLRIPNCELS
jgi:hypothetical protein